MNHIYRQLRLCPHHFWGMSICLAFPIFYTGHLAVWSNEFHYTWGPRDAGTAKPKPSVHLGLTGQRVWMALQSSSTKQSPQSMFWDICRYFIQSKTSPVDEIILPQLSKVLWLVNRVGKWDSKWIPFPNLAENKQDVKLECIQHASSLMTRLLYWLVQHISHQANHQPVSSLSPVCT